MLPWGYQVDEHDAVPYVKARRYDIRQAIAAIFWLLNFGVKQNSKTLSGQLVDDVIILYISSLLLTVLHVMM